VKVVVDFEQHQQNSEEEEEEEEWIILGLRIQNLPSVVEVMLVLLMVYDLVHLANELEGYGEDDVQEMGSV